MHRHLLQIFLKYLIMHRHLLQICLVCLQLFQFHQLTWWYQKIVAWTQCLLGQGQVGQDQVMEVLGQDQLWHFIAADHQVIPGGPGSGGTGSGHGGFGSGSSYVGYGSFCYDSDDLSRPLGKSFCYDSDDLSRPLENYRCIHPLQNHSRPACAWKRISTLHVNLKLNIMKNKYY